MFRTIALASVVGAALVTSASAMSFAPAIPTPVNPHPLNPVATNGTPLPSKWVYDGVARPVSVAPLMGGMLEADAYQPAY